MNAEYNVTTSDTGNPNLTVTVRIRPECEKEIRSKDHRNIVKVLDEHVLIFDPATDDVSSTQMRLSKAFTSNFNKAKDYKYAFDRVFDESCSQQEVYEHTTLPLIDCVLNGYNATVFAYGATGSGKTHTMIGNEKSGAGVMVLTMRDLFRAIEESKSEKKFQISISYLEVYNETIRDLFIKDSPPLMLCEDPAKGTATVTGLSKRFPKTASEVFELLEFGNRNRRQSPTEANACSSRSHAVMQINVKQMARTADVSASVKVGKLSLIDLAGSERACVSQNRGERLKEGANINKSLLALGNCINSLGENYREGKHVPYRNSKLTRLLKDSLGGNCRTVMIANVSPSSLSHEDTLNTLKYANRAKNIKTTVVRNVVNVDYHISKYIEIINELRKEVLELKEQVYGRNASEKNDRSQVSKQFSVELEESRRQINRLEANLYEMREICKEQHNILKEHGLLNPRLQKQATAIIQLCSPPKRVKQAWAPVEPSPSSVSFQQSSTSYVPLENKRHHIESSSQANKSTLKRSIECSGVASKDEALGNSSSQIGDSGRRYMRSLTSPMTPQRILQINRSQSYVQRSLEHSRSPSLGNASIHRNTSLPPPRPFTSSLASHLHPSRRKRSPKFGRSPRDTVYPLIYLIKIQEEPLPQ